MSATHITLQFSAVVEKYENLPAEITEEAERIRDTADIVVRNRLYDAMAETGQRFIDEHPDWFRAGTGLV